MKPIVLTPLADAAKRQSLAHRLGEGRFAPLVALLLALLVVIAVAYAVVTVAAKLIA